MSQKETRRLSILIGIETHRKLRVMAAVNDLTLTEQITALIEQSNQESQET